MNDEVEHGPGRHKKLVSQVSGTGETIEAYEWPQTPECPSDSEIEQSPEPIGMVNGWLVITDAQLNGDQFIVSDKPEGEGELAFFRKTRRLQNSKWIGSGKWSDTVSHQTLTFEPKYYREKNVG